MSTIKVVVNETTSAIVLDKYLNPDTQYECYVTATTSAGEGAPSERVTTRTSESGEQWYAYKLQTTYAYNYVYSQYNLFDNPRKMM